MADACEPVEARGSVEGADVAEAVETPERAPAGSTAPARDNGAALGDDTPRRRGRKPGSPKVPGSGRKAGTPNKVNSDLRELIARRGRPLELLADVCRGVKIRVGAPAGPGPASYVYPTLELRVECAKVLAKKLLPDIASVEIGGAVEVHDRRSDAEIVARLLALAEELGLPFDRGAVTALVERPDSETRH